MIKRLELNLDNGEAEENEQDQQPNNMSTIRYSTQTENIVDLNNSSYIPNIQLSKSEIIVNKRAVFKWMPVLCSNDIVHGSW